MQDLERYTAELSAAWAEAEHHGACVLTPALIQGTILPAWAELKANGWLIPKAQTIRSMATVCQAVIRLDAMDLAPPEHPTRN